MKSRVKVIDLFAGPGGLGEGFSALKDERDRKSVFDVCISAEMDETAFKTLKLRTFFRKTLEAGKVPDSYYEYIAGERSAPFDAETREIWENLGENTKPLELGNKDDDAELDDLISKSVRPDENWVLVGGPPCQAYSLVGRARNVGIKGYSPEKDHRHRLYKDYLRIIRKFRPPVFLMENVKGILSSKLNGKLVFHKILKDLSRPRNGKANANDQGKLSYRLYSLSDGSCFEGGNPKNFDPRKFIVSSEFYGIPQARHRVFVLGVRDDLCARPGALKPHLEPVTCGSALSGLQPLRSGLSREKDSWELWQKAVISEGNKILSGAQGTVPLEVLSEIDTAIKELEGRNSRLERREGKENSGPHNKPFSKNIPRQLLDWYRDARLLSIPNHETRAHIRGDLGRYLFAACFGLALGGTPKARDFPPNLAPDHVNWNSGKFPDRFRVQISVRPSTTITSHISKDGHYFIHPDPEQCRSWTVREAARLQTFPDNYFFEGNRTQQYVQVGNAVPPFLAKKIAGIIWELLNE